MIRTTIKLPDEIDEKVKAVSQIKGITKQDAIILMLGQYLISRKEMDTLMEKIKDTMRNLNTPVEYPYNKKEILEQGNTMIGKCSSE